VTGLFISHVKDGSSQKTGISPFETTKTTLWNPKKLAFHPWNLPSVNGWNPSTNQTWLQNRPRSRVWLYAKGVCIHHAWEIPKKNKSSSFLRRNLMSEAKNHDIPSIVRQTLPLFRPF
jgi:hypothetical protein